MPTAVKRRAGTITTPAGQDLAAPWDTPNNAQQIDGTIATSTDAGSADGTDDIALTNWGFNIPGDADITGVGVEIVHLSSSPVDNTGLFLVGTGVSSDQKFIIDEPSGPTIQNSLAGGANDLWGAELTPAKINSDTFGVKYRVTVRDGFDSASLDGMVLTVHYSLGERTERTHRTERVYRPA